MTDDDATIPLGGRPPADDSTRSGRSGPAGGSEARGDTEAGGDTEDRSDTDTTGGLRSSGATRSSPTGDTGSSGNTGSAGDVRSTDDAEPADPTGSGGSLLWPDPADSDGPGNSDGPAGSHRSGDSGDLGSGGAAAGRTGSVADRADPAGRRRRRLIRFGVAGAVLVVLLVCASAGTVAFGVSRLAHSADQARDARSRVDAGCVDLERRLNRLAPPGAAANPSRRAAAIRAENVALGPFLGELDAGQRPGHRPGGPDRNRRGPDRPSLTDAWHRLVDARTAYADALDGQAAGRGPAFFAAPKDRLGRPLFDRLAGSPRSCDGAVRRLTAPDL